MLRRRAMRGHFRANLRGGHGVLRQVVDGVCPAGKKCCADGLCVSSPGMGGRVCVEETLPCNNAVAGVCPENMDCCADGLCQDTPGQLWLINSLYNNNILRPAYKKEKRVIVRTEFGISVKVEVAVLGAPSLIILVVSMNVRHHDKRRLCWDGGGGANEYTSLGYTSLVEIGVRT